MEPKVVDPYNLSDSWSVDPDLSSGKSVPFSRGGGLSGDIRERAGCCNYSTSDTVRSRHEIRIYMEASLDSKTVSLKNFIYSAMRFSFIASEAE